MTRWAIIVLCWLLPLAALAGGDKRVSHRYNDVSIAEALKQLGKECKGRYVINFMYDELEEDLFNRSVCEIIDDCSDENAKMNIKMKIACHKKVQSM